MVDDRIIIPKSLRYAALKALYSGQPRIKKMFSDATIFSWPNMREDIEKKSKPCSACLNAGKNLKFQIPQTEKKNKNRTAKNTGQRNPTTFYQESTQQETIFHSVYTPYIITAVHKNSCWTVTKTCKNTNHETVIIFLKAYMNVYGVPQQK